ncbi:hypothetical protein Bbelb_092160 [Branchiostoma belcheri]|nr:hypothetical protein Bbelb_092160 [Branchiostoma belcheri]
MAEDTFCQISGNFLECAICQEPFKDPKMLPCLDTFCNGCLEKFVVNQAGQGKEVFPCPTCQNETVLPEGGVAGLKDNFFAVSFSDTVKAHNSLVSKEDTKVPCDLCEEDLATQGCVPCEEFMCDECACAHRRFKRTRGHEVVSVPKLKEQLIAKMKSFRSKSLPTCPKHQDEKVKFYCVTCKCPVCRDCTVLQHKGHKYWYLHNVGPDERAEIKGKLEAARLTITKKQDLASVLAQKQSELDSKSKKAADDIDAAAEEEIKYLRHKQAELKEKLAAITEARSQQLSAVADSVASTLSCLSSTVDFSQIVVEHGSDFDIMNVSSDITARLDPLLRETTTNILDCINDVEFVPKDKTERENEVVLGNIRGEDVEGELQAEATIRLTMENFSQVKEKFSETVFIRNLPWKLMVKREHDRKAIQPKDKKTLGVYLYCDAEADIPWNCTASAELRLLPQKAGVKVFKKEIDYPFFSECRRWGHLDFMPLHEVCDPQKGYIKDDKIVLEAYVKAHTPSSRGTLCKIVRGEMFQSEATLRFTIDKFDFSANPAQVSNAVFIRNMPWKLLVRRIVPNEDKPRIKALSVYLRCDADSNSLWSCKASVELRLVSQKEGVQNIKKKIQRVFYRKENNRGFQQFVLWDVARDPEKGYIKDNKFVFEAYIQAEAPRIMICP